jgi:hypothetical protein
MKIYLHPFESDGILSDVAISPDEAEEWVDQLRAAVRNVREGRGDQLMLFGEPAQMTLTVTDRGAFHKGEKGEGEASIEDEAQPARFGDIIRLASRVSAPHLLALFVLVVLLELAIRFIP